MADISDALLMFIITSGIGCVLAIVRACYKSKCSRVRFCCFELERDTMVERNLDEMRPMDRQPSSVSL